MRITVLQNQILLYIPRVLIPHALIHLHQKFYNDSPLYTAETNDSNTGETLDENESSNNDFIDDPIHNNVTEEETIEEPTNDSNPNGDAGILTYESTDSDIITSSGEIIGIRVP